jgi:hypothetical protein
MKDEVKKEQELSVFTSAFILPPSSLLFVPFRTDNPDQTI